MDGTTLLWAFILLLIVIMLSYTIGWTRGWNYSEKLERERRKREERLIL